MSSLVRNLIALLAGTVVAIVGIGLVQVLAHRAYPPPAGVDIRDEAVRETMMLNAPIPALLLVALSYFTGTFFGAWVAARLSADAHARQGYLIGGMMLISGIMNLRAIPHPGWFWAASIASFVVAAYLGAQLGARQRG